jgi:hypothetical protein
MDRFFQGIGRFVRWLCTGAIVGASLGLATVVLGLAAKCVLWMVRILHWPLGYVLRLDQYRSTPFVHENPLNPDFPDGTALRV